MQKFALIPLIVLYILGFISQAGVQAQPEVIPIGNITVLGNYSKVCGGSNLSGVYVSGNFAPVVKLTPQDFFIPLYSGLYKKQSQIINEEEGGRLYTTTMSHNFSFMHKHLYSELLTQRVTSFVSLNYNKETSDESFGDGLYDYRDYGVNLDYQYNLIKTETDTGTILFGGKYYFRKYPNFKSLISLTRGNVPEKDEKDQKVWGTITRYTHKFADKLLLTLSYDFLFKRFADKHTVDLNGILEDKKREDNVHYFKLNLDYRVGERFILGLDGEIELNNSNQNYYDTKNTTADFSDDVFVPHYFNYNRCEISPALTYLIPLEENRNIAFKIAYAYTARDYSNRNVKDAQGAYKSDLQEDRIHAGSFNVNYPITEKLSFLFNVDYTHNTSNMEYEQYYRYDYDTYNILSGLSYKF